MGLSRTKGFIDLLKKELPNETPIIAIRVGSSPQEDSRRSYFDNANQQVSDVCNSLRSNPELSGGFNAIGLSQGGLLFRALVERCDGLKVNNLITLGSPLQGVAAYPGCGKGNGWTSMAKSRVVRALFKKTRENLLPCRVIQALVGTSVYSGNAQRNLMPAQYFKDPNNISGYLNSNHFLADINNERPVSRHFVCPTVRDEPLSSVEQKRPVQGKYQTIKQVCGLFL